jgi:hypothetical protein
VCATVVVLGRAGGQQELTTVYAALRIIVPSGLTVLASTAVQNSARRLFVTFFPAFRSY